MISQPSQAKDVRWKQGSVGRQDVGAVPPEDASEQAELEDHVVPRDRRRLPAADTGVIGGSNQDSEVGSVCLIDERLKRVQPRLEDTLIPEDYLTVGKQLCL